MNRRQAQQIREGIHVFRSNWPRFEIYSPHGMAWRTYCTVVKLQDRARIRRR